MADEAVTPPAPEPVIAPPTAPAMVPVTVEEYQRLRSTEAQLAEMKRANALILEKAEADRIKALADKGQVDEAMKQLREAETAKRTEAETRYAGLESQYLGEKKANVIGDSLAGRDFVSPEAAAQAKTLLDARFESTRDASGQIMVREKSTGRPAAEVIRETLDSPSFAHFMKPSTTGGANAGGSKPAPVVTESAETMTVSDALIANAKNRAESRNPYAFGR